jgi:hypothetical protein
MTPMTDRAISPPPRRLIVQHLEGGPDLHRLAPGEAVEPLRAARAVGMTDACLGWRLPRHLVDAVFAWRDAEAPEVRLWLWHPLLAGDGAWEPGPDGAIGADGRPVPPFRGMPEFSFACPVREGVLAAALTRLSDALATAAWDGVFLDKIRWPSPAPEPACRLACFCDACLQRAGDEAGIDVARVASVIAGLDTTLDGRRRLLRALAGVERVNGLEPFLAWRSSVITGVVAEAAALARGAGAAVALDVFAPSLAPLVGQEIGDLARLGEWTKAMCYTATLGPAGMAFELLDLAGWLGEAGAPSPSAILRETFGYPVPAPAALRRRGLGPRALAIEIERLRRLAGPAAAVGLELVEIPGVAELDRLALARRIRLIGRTGLPIVVSWDLRHVPPDRLTLLRPRAPRSGDRP